MINRFWTTLDQLVETSEIEIDRPKGSRHPRFTDVVYPLDYGYLAGTGAIDGGGIDVWIGSQPSHGVVGVIATVDLFKCDAELKVLLGCTEEESRLALDTVNTGSQAAVLILRPG